MFYIKNTPETEVGMDRPDIIHYAIYYNIITKEDLDKYKPHILMFGNRHIATIILDDNKWILFNKKNAPELFNKLYKKLKKVKESKISNLLPIADLVFTDRGIYHKLPDLIPDDLFYLCLSVANIEYKDYLSYRGDFTQVVSRSVPRCLQIYNNTKCLRYESTINGYVEVSLKKIREIEGYYDFSDSFNYQNYLNNDNCDMDYSIYSYNP